MNSPMSRPDLIHLPVFLKGQFRKFDSFSPKSTAITRLANGYNCLVCIIAEGKTQYLCAEYAPVNMSVLSFRTFVHSKV